MKNLVTLVDARDLSGISMVIILKDLMKIRVISLIVLKLPKVY